MWCMDIVMTQFARINFYDVMSYEKLTLSLMLKWPERFNLIHKFKAPFLTCAVIYTHQMSRTFVCIHFCSHDHTPLA